MLMSLSLVRPDIRWLHNAGFCRLACQRRIDAVNKAYADSIKYKTATGNILNTVITDHILFTFPAAKAFAGGKIKICEMWIERLADDWITTSCPILASEWPGFHKFSRGPFLITLSLVFPQAEDAQLSSRLRRITVII